MSRSGARKRCIEEQSGFTLVEMLVTITIMIVVLFALYGIFDMSIRVFTFGNDKVEATENARLGLEKMEREIRGAFPVDTSDSTMRYLFFSADGSTGPPSDPPPEAMPTATQITFGNELGANGDGKITCPNPEGNCEYITYRLQGTTLRRVNAASSSGSGAPVVEFVQNVQFTYLENDGVTTATSQADIAIVRMELTINKGGRVQTLTTDVDLRNREND